MTDGAATYPASLAAVWPGVLHDAGKRIRQPIGLGHQYPKCRPRPIRGFKTLAGARVPCRAHAFLRNLQGQFYDLAVAAAGAGAGCPDRRLARELTLEMTPRFALPSAILRSAHPGTTQ